MTQRIASLLRASGLRTVGLAALLALGLAPQPGSGLSTSVAAIQADWTTLNANGFAVDGSGVRIVQLDTQVSTNHPGLAGQIENMSDFTGEPLLSPSSQLFGYQNPPGTHRIWINDDHGTPVAGVVVGSGLDQNAAQTGNAGVAPGATLAIGKTFTSQIVTSEDFRIRASLALATGSQAGSLGQPYRQILLITSGTVGATGDGTSEGTKSLDYLAYQRDVLPVLAVGNTPNNLQFSIPADAYNGLTVGATAGPNFTQVASYSSQGPTDGIERTKPDLVAPGSVTTTFGGWEDNDGIDASAADAYVGAVPANLASFQSPNINAAQDADPDYRFASGTSYAAPHVAGVAALLQQWSGVTLQGLTAEVERAVIVNSVDKIQGVLGMSKTIVDRNGDNWLQSEAYTSQVVPLDDQMGAGQVNALRALIQYDAGYYAPGDVPPIGWSQSIGFTQATSFHDYVIETVLPQNTFLSATLAWDRPVEYADAGTVGLWEPGVDSFIAHAPDNLDLYLLPAGSNNLADAVWSSRSSVDNLEHIFFQIQDTNQYKLRVVFNGGEHAPLSSSSYGLAWWTTPEPGTALLLWLGLLILHAGQRRLAA